MKGYTISKEVADRFYEEAEILGIATKYHHTDCIARAYSCPTQKDVYLTYEKAVKALRMRSHRERTKRVYKCDICGHYHLTTNDGECRKPKRYSRSRERKFDNKTRMMLENEKIMHVARNLRPKKNRYIISMNRDVQFAYAG